MVAESRLSGQQIGAEIRNALIQLGQSKSTGRID
jgi:hypothetical protein